MPAPKEVDIRTEMRVSLFWRGLIGDGGYVKFDPDDLLRWYFALELRGPDEIRQVMTERYRGRPMPTMQGVVAQAPHPPLWLVNTWLEHREKRHSNFGIWAMAGSFLVVAGMALPALHGCADLTTLNPLALNPPPGTPNVTAYAVTPSSFATAPSQAGATTSPINNGAPIVSPAPTQTGPVSGGIAGAASGSVSPTGATGASNNGISAGSPP